MSANPPLTGSALPAHAGGGRRHSRQVLLATAVVVLAAAAVGFLIGRATKTGGEAAAPSWQTLPRAPIAGRDSPFAVWTGKEMLVWGGTTAETLPTPCTTCSSGGAAYDPATRTWRRIASSPPRVLGTGAVWTGDGMVVWASHSPDGPVGAAVYGLATNSWRTLPVGPLGRREGAALAWTGTELLVVGGALGDHLATPTAAALNPRTGSWRPLPALNRLNGLLPQNPLVWVGGKALLMDSSCAGPAPGGGRYSCSLKLLTYDPATDTLRTTFVKPPIVPEQQLAWVGRDGGELVFSIVGVGTNVNSGRAALVRYDPATGGWMKGAFSPYPVPSNLTPGTQSAWLGDRYVVADGSSGLKVYSIATDTWTTITPGPSPLNNRWGSAIVWTGADLIAWGGSGYDMNARNPADRFPTHADGVSLVLPRTG